MIKAFCIIDDFIIDRLCQPISDALWFKEFNNFDIAKSLFIGSGVLHTASILSAATPLGTSTIFFAIILYMAIIFLCNMATRFDNITKSGKTANPLRIGIRPIRLAFVVMLAFMWIFEPSSTIELSVIFSKIQLFAYVAAIYFMSCNNRPPEQKTFIRYAEI